MAANGWPRSRWEQPDLDADRVGDAGRVAGVAGDDRGLVANGGHDDDRVDDVGGPGGGAGEASGTAGGLVVGEDVAGLEDPGDLVLGTAAPGLGQDDDRDERPDARSGQFVVQGEEVWVDAFPSGDPSLRAALAHLGLRAPAANWRPWLALAAAHLMGYGDTLVRDAVQAMTRRSIAATTRTCAPE